MSGKEPAPPESCPKRFAKALTDEVWKTTVKVLVTGVLAWLAILLARYYDVLPCPLRKILFLALSYAFSFSTALIFYSSPSSSLDCEMPKIELKGDFDVPVANNLNCASDRLRESKGELANLRET